MNEIKIQFTDNGKKDFSYVIVEGIEKNKKNERIMTEAVLSLFEEKIFTKITLNNWKNGNLLIRFAQNNEKLEKLVNIIERERNTPKTHSERSLLYEEGAVWEKY